MVRLAARMEQDVAAFEQGLHGKRPIETPFITGVVSAGPRSWRGPACNSSPIWSTASCRSRRCARRWAFIWPKPSDGYARFDGVPEFRHYNPIGTVHGGFAATLLDSALGCAIFTTLAKGEAWTTLELKLNFVRPINKDTGTVRAEGRIIDRGRTVATAEGTVKDKAGKLYAHATTTCMVFPAKG